MKLKLTPKIVRDLKPNPKGGDLFVTDALLPGFGVRVYPSGQKAYWWNSRREGRQTIGSTELITLEEARDVARENKRLYRKGINVRKHRAAEIEANLAAERRSALTISVALDEYFRHRTDWSAATQKNYAICRRYIEQEFGDQHPADLAAPDWIAVLAEYRAETPGIANNVLAVAKGMYKWLTTASAHARDVTGNPVRDVSTTKLAARTNYLLPQDLRRLYDVVAGDRNEFEAAAIQMLILTARRPSEIRELAWTEVDFDKGAITIPGERTKTGAEDTFPLTLRMAAILKSVPRHNGPLVFSRDGGHTPISLNLARVREMLGDVPDFTGEWRFHDFRTSLGTAMDDADAPYHEKEIMLSHSLGALDRTYSRSNRLGLQTKWFEWWDGTIFGADHA